MKLCSQDFINTHVMRTRMSSIKNKWESLLEQHTDSEETDFSHAHMTNLLPWYDPSYGTHLHH